MIAAGGFRAGLYYRLNVLPIRLPALRERSGMPCKSLGADALQHLAQHDWPGNIRELRNRLEQATLMTDDMLLGAAHFGPLGDAAAAPAAPRVVPAAPVPCADVAAIKPLAQAVAELEAQAIRAALAATGGNKLAASREKLASLR